MKQQGVLPGLRLTQDDVVPRTRNNLLTIWHETEAVDRFIVMMRHLVPRFSRGNILELNGVIFGTSDNGPAVWGESKCINLVGVAA